jgi:hypothetical protein
LFAFGDMIFTIGDCSSMPERIWYLKKDFSDDIFRFTDLELRPVSFNDASQLRTNADEIDASGVSPNWSRINA